MPEDRKKDGGGKGENKISHKLAVTVIDGTGSEEAKAAVRARNGAVQVPWLEGAAILNPDLLPPTHTNPQAHFPKTTAAL